MAAIIAVCSWISIGYTRQGGTSTLWIASGVLTGILLTSPRSTWRGTVLAALIPNLLVRVMYGDAWYSVLGLGAASTFEATLVALVVGHHVKDVTDPATVKRVSILAIASTFAACALSAMIAAAVHAVSGKDPLASFQTWFASHILGMVIFATLTLVTRAQGSKVWGRRGHRIELALSVLLVATTCFGVFSQSRYPILFLVFPPLVLLVFRHRFAGLVWGMAAVVVSSIVESLRGVGPLQLIPGAGPFERIFLLQIFIATVCLTTWPIAIVLTERAILRYRLRESERVYRLLADYSTDMVVRLRPDGQQLYMSPSAKEMLGWELEELGPQARWDLIHPDDLALFSQSMKDLVKKGGVATTTYRIRHKDGHFVWIEALSRLVLNGDSGQREIISTNRDVSRRVEVEQALDALARYDTLTGLPNRFHFHERAEQALARHRRSSRPIALLYLDIDRFKQINDGMGHAAGDEVLREFARRIKGTLRITDFAARLGGDEFVILLEDVGTRCMHEAVAQKIVAAMQPAFVIDTTSLLITTSIGIVLCTTPMSGQDEMLHVADMALYKAKEAGRNRYHISAIEAA